jgi:hypothetical protein
MNASGAAAARRSALALNGPNADSAYEFGYTRDARSLSVSERYLWWTFGNYPPPCHGRQSLNRWRDGPW